MLVETHHSTTETLRLYVSFSYNALAAEAFAQMMNLSPFPLDVRSDQTSITSLREQH